MNLVSNTGDHCAAGHKSAPFNLDCSCEVETEKHKPTSGKASCFCEAILTGKPWSFEAEELVTSPRPRPQPRIWVKWYQRRIAKFDDPEFYAIGLVASVGCGDDMFRIVGEGDRCWEQKGETTSGNLSIQNSKDFREQFPNGKLPADGENGWTVVHEGCFELYPSLYVPSIDEVFYSLEEAIGWAKDTLGELPAIP
jgi:hypothetical protein